MPEYTERLSGLGAAAGVRLQFCASSRWLETNAVQIERLERDGHAVDGYLSVEDVTALDDTVRIGEMLAEIEARFHRHGVSWWGLALSELPPIEYESSAAFIDMLCDRGYRWLASLTDQETLSDARQPQLLAADLVGIPCAGWRDDAILSNGHPGQASHSVIPGETRIRRVTHDMENAAASGEIRVLRIHAGTLSADDPQARTIQAIIDRSRSLQIPLVTLNEIADVTVARAQAAPAIRARVSIGQYLYHRDYWDTKIGPGQQAYKIYDYRGGWRLRPGFYRSRAGMWQTLREPDVDNGFRINRHGYRGTSFPHRKPREETRIAILGDSCVFGIGGDDSPWPAKTESRLRDLAGPDRIRVINAGIEGQSSVHCLMRIDRLLTFEPDLVVVAVAANDIFIENPADYVDTTGLHYATSWEIVGEYPREREIVNTVGGVRRPMTLKTFYPFSYDYHLREIVRRCRQVPVTPVLMTVPGLLPADIHLATESHLQKMHHPPFVDQGDMATMRHLYDIYNGAVMRVASEEQVAIIDCERFITSSYDDRRHELFSDTCHPTAQGNAYIGRFVAERLWDLLPVAKAH